MAGHHVRVDSRYCLSEFPPQCRPHAGAPARFDHLTEPEANPLAFELYSDGPIGVEGADGRRAAAPLGAVMRIHGRRSLLSSWLGSLLASQSAIVCSGQPTTAFDSRVGFGIRPSRSQRQMVVFEMPSRF